MTRIYFNDKALSIFSDSETVAADEQTYMIRNAGEKNIAEAVEKIQTSDSVTLVSSDPDKLFRSLKEKFRIIQAAGGFVYDKDQVLFIFRKGKWDLPKGKLDEGESLETCAVREVEEETGTKNIRLRELLHVSYHTYTEKDKNILKETYWYLMEGDASLPVVAQKDEGIDECIWIRKDSLEQYLSNSYELIREVVEAGAKKLQE